MPVCVCKTLTASPSAAAAQVSSTASSNRPIPENPLLLWENMVVLQGGCTGTKRSKVRQPIPQQGGHGLRTFHLHGVAAVLNDRHARAGDLGGKKLVLLQREKGVLPAGDDQRRTSNGGQASAAVVVVHHRLDLPGHHFRAGPLEHPLEHVHQSLLDLAVRVEDLGNVLGTDLFEVSFLD